MKNDWWTSDGGVDNVASLAHGGLHFNTIRGGEKERTHYLLLQTHRVWDEEWLAQPEKPPPNKAENLLSVGELESESPNDDDHGPVGTVP